MSIELSPELAGRLEASAEATGRTASEIAARALADYLDYTDLLARDVNEAEQEADRVGWLSTEEAARRLGLDAYKKTA